MARVKIGNVYPTDEYLLARCAPAGYGLGEDTKQYIRKADLDNTFVTGIYWVDCTGTFVQEKLFNFALLRVTGMGQAHCVQELFPLGHSMKLIRIYDGGTWQEGWGLTTWNNDVTL